MDQIKKQKIINRSGGICELCGENPLEVIYSLLRKGAPADEDALYSMLGLCKKCAASLKRGSKVKTTRSIKLVIFNNKNQDVKILDGKMTNKAIKEKIKGNYDIFGPFLATDVISKQKISYILSQK